jgi:AcrR family transcriptional regulator
MPPFFLAARKGVKNMDGFARRKEQSREDIRKAAWELFSQFGVGKVSVADIARKAGVSQATIYNNFNNKETLAREFVSAAVEHLVSRTLDVLTPQMLYQEKMAAFIQFISEIMVEARPSPADSAIFTSSFDLQNDPEIKKIRSEAQVKMTNVLLGLIQEGKQQGQVNPALSEEALGIYFGIFMNVFTDPGLQHRYYQHPELVRELGSMMLHGLSGEQK